MVFTLPSRWTDDEQPAFHGPTPARGTALSLCNDRVLWLTPHAPLLLDLNLAIRVWDLWPGTGAPNSFLEGPYVKQTQTMIRSMTQHQDWLAQAVITENAAYLLGTWRGTPTGPDDPVPQSNQLVAWEFGTTAWLSDPEFKLQVQRRRYDGTEFVRTAKTRPRKRRRSRSPRLRNRPRWSR